MDRHDDHDNLMNRLARLDGAAGTTPLSEGALDRVARVAMTGSATPWTRTRLRLASFGAMFGSGAVVVAGIVGLQAAATGALPVLAIGAPAAHDNAFGTSRTPTASTPVDGMMIPYLDYEFTSGPGLATSSGTAVAYELVSSVDASTAVTQLAQDFNVDGSLDPSSGDGYYQIGADDGPNVSAWDDSGVVDWTYSGASQETATSGADPDDQTPPPDPTLPSDTQASSDAVTLLEGLGIDASTLGPAQVDSSSGSEVDVTVPMVVDGLSTDQSYYVSYGHDDSLLFASGLLAAATPGPTYPTISPVDAVGVLSAHHGFVFYGGVMPMEAGGVATAPNDTSPSSTDPGASSDPGSSDGSGDTTTTTEPSPPVVQVEIDGATLGLGTYTLTDGTTWLLATWQLSGPESGDSAFGTGTYQANILAVDSQYVQLPSNGVN